MKRQLNLKDICIIASINFFWLTAFILLPIYGFVDKWTIDNADRSDIIARGPFLAGLLFIPGLIIFSIIILAINIWLYRKLLNFFSLLIGLIIDTFLSLILFFTGFYYIFFIPGRLIDRVFNYGHYVYLIVLISVSIILVRKFKETFILRDRLDLSFKNNGA